LRRLLLAALVVFAGCSSTPKTPKSESERPVIDEPTARAAAVDAWGVGFESRHFDLMRELSDEEKKLMNEELSRKSGTPVTVRGSIFTSNSPPDRVVDEVRKLRPGRAMSFCETWHTEKRSGDVIETGSEKPSKPVPFAVITRGPDGKLHASRFEAMSHEEALSRR
jgi:hypothetical protein